MHTKIFALAALLACCSSAFSQQTTATVATHIEKTSGTAYWVFVSNERDGTVSMIDGAAARETVENIDVETIPAGKRPRGIEASPDGKLVYVALSGSPIQGPPKLDAQGNPIFEDDDDVEADHSADGIGVIDVTTKKFMKKIPAGSDPEEFAISPDGKKLYVANEDVATMSIVNSKTGEIEMIVPVKEEPEGVAVTPDGRSVYVTCETNGEVCVIDTISQSVLSETTVGGRPRSTAFLPDGSLAFVPSESSGIISVMDMKTLAIEDKIQLPEGSRPMSLAMTRDGKTLFASTGRGGKILVIDPHSRKVLDSIAVGKRPWGIALSPDDSLLFAANGPSNDVSVVDTKTRKEITRIPTGESPWGVAVALKPEP
jgi:YVTN family beta-propeller protein